MCVLKVDKVEKRKPTKPTDLENVKMWSVLPALEKLSSIFFQQLLTKYLWDIHKKVVEAGMYSV